MTKQRKNSETPSTLELNEMKISLMLDGMNEQEADEAIEEMIKKNKKLPQG